MRDNFFRHFGIYRFEVFIKNSAVMLRNKEDCITVASEGKQEAKIMECIDAISLLDARELFIFDNYLHIKTVKGDLCIEAEQNSKFVKANDCKQGDNLKDNRNKWLVDTESRIVWRGDKSKCLNIAIGKEYQNFALQKPTKASSCSPDDQASTNNAVDGSENTFWASRPGEIDSYFIVFLDGNIAKSITIHWMYPPEHFELKLLVNQELWVSVYMQKNNELNEFTYEMRPQKLFGVKIFMNSPTSQIEGKGVFGIKEISVEGGVKGLIAEDCKNGDKSKSNRFVIIDSEFVDFESRNIVEKEILILYKKSNVLLDSLNQLIKIPSAIKKYTQKAKEISETLDKLGDQLFKLDLNFQLFEKELQDPDQTLSSLESSGESGSHFEFPAESCESIKRKNPLKCSGFFWIKPFCGSMALRGFCDFSQKPPMFYYLHDRIQSAKNLQEIRRNCADYGLYPIELRNLEQIHVLQKLILSLNIKMKKETIPLGFDYACLNLICNGEYRSFSSDNTINLGIELTALLDKNIVSNNDFTLDYYEKRNSIGFALNSGKMMYFDLEKATIKNQLCSDNPDPNDYLIINANCSTSPSGNRDFFSIQNTNLKVICPSDCSIKIDAPVWGNGLYRFDSSICRAAIHAGVIKDEEGGKIEIGIERDQNKFEGSEKNGIISESCNEDETWQTFVVNKFQVVCPKNNIDLKASSFSQMKLKLKMKSKLKSKMKLKLKQQEDNGKNSGNQDEEEEKYVSPADKKYTEDGLKTLNQLFNSEIMNLKRNIKLSKNAQVLIMELKKLLSPVINSHLNNQFLSYKLTDLIKHFKGTSNSVKKYVRLSTIKLKQIFRKYQINSIQKITSDKWNPYEEKYEFLFEDMYDVIDNPKSTNLPSKWGFFSEHLTENHVKELGHTKKINCMGLDCFASLLLLKYKKFYDGKIKLNLIINDIGKVGFIFRAKDNFNFYSFELSVNENNSKVGFKQIKRYSEGASEILSRVLYVK